MSLVNKFRLLIGFRFLIRFRFLTGFRFLIGYRFLIGFRFLIEFRFLIGYRFLIGFSLSMPVQTPDYKWKFSITFSCFCLEGAFVFKILIDDFFFISDIWQNIWMCQSILVTCLNKNYNFIISKCTMQMATTNLMAVNSSNPLSIGMVSQKYILKFSEIRKCLFKRP